MQQYRSVIVIINDTHTHMQSPIREAGKAFPNLIEMQSKTIQIDSFFVEHDILLYVTTSLHGC
jgi:hypothetical protein